MKYKSVGLIVLALMALIMAVSCPGAPPPVIEEPVPVPTDPIPTEPVPPQVIPPTQADLSALDAAAARAADARRKAGDFDGDYHFPSEWDSAQLLYDQAGRLRDVSSSQAVRESAARYTRAAEAFEALAGRAVIAAYEFAERELNAAREAAIEAGAERLAPDFLLAADNKVDRALAEFEAGDHHAAKATATTAYQMYNILVAGLNAYRMREEILSKGFEAHDPRNFEEAEDSLFDAIDYFAAGNFIAAFDNAENALYRFTQTLNLAWEAYASEQGAFAAAWRQIALNFRADVAVRQEFGSADSIFGRANTAFRGGNFETAARLFVQCGNMFMAVAETAREMRYAAEEALIRADLKVAESDELARTVEIIVEGGVE